jgi:hypothetical protein
MAPPLQQAAADAIDRLVEFLDLEKRVLTSCKLTTGEGMDKPTLAHI